MQNITNNFSGPNSRMNLNSIDISTNISKDFSPKQLQIFTEEVRSVLSQFSKDIIKSIEAQLTIIEEESCKQKPENGRVHSALQSIAENASGTIIATIAISLINTLV